MPIFSLWNKTIPKDCETSRFEPLKISFSVSMTPIHISPVNSKPVLFLTCPFVMARRKKETTVRLEPLPYFGQEFWLFFNWHMNNRIKTYYRVKLFSLEIEFTHIFADECCIWD